jgi:hypothetical protein
LPQLDRFVWFSALNGGFGEKASRSNELMPAGYAGNLSVTEVDRLPDLFLIVGKIFNHIVP